MLNTSYLSRRAFEGGVPPDGGAAVPGAPPPEHIYDPHKQMIRGSGSVGGGSEGGGKGSGRDGRKQPIGRGAPGSFRSRTTAGLTTYEDDFDSGFGTATSGAGGAHEYGHAGHSGLSHQGRPSPFKENPDYGSEYSDDDSLGSLASGVSQPLSTMSSVVADSSAGQIVGMLCALDDLVLEVKVSVWSGGKHQGKVVPSRAGLRCGRCCQRFRRTRRKRATLVWPRPLDVRLQLLLPRSLRSRGTALLFLPTKSEM